MRLRTTSLFFVLFALLLVAAPIAAQEEYPPLPVPLRDEWLLLPDAIYHGLLSADMGTHGYVFLADAGDQIDLVMERDADANFFPQLELLNTTRESLVVQTAEGLSGRRAHLEYSIETRGWYFVAAGADRTGAASSPEGIYTLQLTGATNDVYALLPVGMPPNSTASGVLLADSHIEGHLTTAPVTYLIPLDAGMTVTVGMEADPAVKLSLIPENPTGGEPLQGEELSYTAAEAQWVSLVLESENETDFVLEVMFVSPDGNFSIQKSRLRDWLTPTATPVPTMTLTPTLTLTPSATTTPTSTWTPTYPPTRTPTPTLKPLPTLKPDPTDTPTRVPSPTPLVPSLNGTVLEITQTGSPLNARANPSTNANILDVLLWGDRVLWGGNRVNGGGYAWYEIVLGNGQRAYIVDNPAYAVVRDPAQTTRGIRVGATITITSDGSGMHLRTNTSTSAREVSTLFAGQQLQVIDGPAYAEYYLWWQLKLPNGQTGWAVDVPGWWRVAN